VCNASRTASKTKKLHQHCSRGVQASQDCCVSRRNHKVGGQHSERGVRIQESGMLLKVRVLLRCFSQQVLKFLQLQHSILVGVGPSQHNPPMSHMDFCKLAACHWPTRAVNRNGRVPEEVWPHSKGYSPRYDRGNAASTVLPMLMSLSQHCRCTTVPEAPAIVRPFARPLIPFRSLPCLYRPFSSFHA
jgi:hypothetical protein